MKISATLTGLVATSLAFAAFAGDPAKKASFESLDKDSDGKVTAIEAAQHEGLESGFATADSDGDGSVSRTEFSSWRTAEASSPSSSDMSSSNPSSSSTSSSSPSSPSTTSPSSSSSDTLSPPSSSSDVSESTSTSTASATMQPEAPQQ